MMFFLERRIVSMKYDQNHICGGKKPRASGEPNGEALLSPARQVS
jgi:hypothetical protein